MKDIQHIDAINKLLLKARQYEGVDEEEAALLAEEVIRLRSVIAHLAPFMVQAAEEVVDYARELEESGVDPREPALVGLNETINRLRIVFKA